MRVVIVSVEKSENVTFLKEIEDNKNRPGTKIYLERHKNEEVVRVLRDNKPPSSQHFPAKQDCTLPSHFLVSINKFESPTVGFYYPRFPLK